MTDSVIVRTAILSPTSWSEDRKNFKRHIIVFRDDSYTSPSTRTSLSVLLALRGGAERLLENAYPAVKVDCSGGKCIALSGGSLALPVDVVPAHWEDTAAYQASGQEQDRGVTILDKKVPKTIDNLPFLHI